MTTQRIGLFALLLATAVGCSGPNASGGQTGSETGECWNVRTPLALDETSALGFSANDSLSLAQGVHTAAIQWLPVSDYPYGPESGSSSIDVTVTSLGSAMYATTDSGTGSGSVQTEVGCAPAVLNNVAVTLHTTGGAFDESFDTTLASSTSDAATLNPTLLAGHIAGSFAFDPTALGSARLAQIDVNVSFQASDSGASAFSGSLAATIEQSSGTGGESATSARQISLACWGNQPGCAE